MPLSGGSLSMESDDNEFGFTHMRRIHFARAYQIEEDKSKWPTWITENEDIYKEVHTRYTRSMIKPFVPIVGDWVVETSDPTELSFIPDGAFHSEYTALGNYDEDLLDEYLTEEEVEALGLSEDEVEWVEIEYEDDEE